MSERWRLPPEVEAAIDNLPKAAGRRLKGRLFNSDKTTVAVGSNGKFLGIVAEGQDKPLPEGASLITVTGRAGTGAKPKQYLSLGFASVEEARAASVNFPGRRRGQRSPVLYQRVKVSRVFGADLARGVREADEFTARRDRALDLAREGARKLVIDTSVVAAGIGNPKGAGGQILQMVLAGEIMPVAIQPLIDELGVIRPAKGGELLLEDYQSHVLPLSLTDTGRRLLPRNLVGDPGDLPVVKTALFEEASPLPIVTNDKRHLLAARRVLAEKFGIEVYLPEELLQEIASGVLGTRFFPPGEAEKIV